MHSPSSQPRWIRFVDRASVALFALAWSAVILRLAGSAESARLDLALPVGLVAGYALADLVSGAVHWLADRYFDPRTPVLGPMLIAPFREHHRDARAITRHDFFEVSGNNGLVTLPIAVALLLLPRPEGPGAAFLAITATSLGLAVFATNLFHRWAHMPSPPTPVRRLQQCRLILSPEHHALHHQPAHDRAYCVTSGWLNPLMDRYRVFPTLERWIDSFHRVPARTETDESMLAGSGPEPDFEPERTSAIDV